jgi:cell division septum initiation protein DivIVA
MLQHSDYISVTAEDFTSIPDSGFVEPEKQQIKVPSLSVFSEIDRLEETILTSPRLPLTGKTIVNEEELLTQLDQIRSSLPEIIAAAQQIIEYKDILVKDAQQQVQQILSEANQRAYHVANELGIIDRSEQEAQRIRQITLSDCEHLRQQTTIEMERVRNHNIQEIERMHRQVIVECEEVQDGADEYAERVLHDLEHQLSDILKAIQRGRQRLNPEVIEAKVNL